MKRILLFLLFFMPFMYGKSRAEVLLRRFGLLSGASGSEGVSRPASFQAKSAAGSGIKSLKLRNLLQQLHANEKKLDNEYYTFYFTVPREELFKKRVLAIIGNQLKRSGFHKDVDEVHYKPLLNYLASLDASKPILAYFRPDKLVTRGGKEELIREKEKFGSPRTLQEKDFGIISAYNPVALKRLIKLANDSTADKFGGQVLVQLSIPKYMAENVVEVFTNGEQQPIDVVMQDDVRKEHRLRNSQVKLYLQPDGDYGAFKLNINELMDQQRIKQLWQQMEDLAKKAAQQVIDAVAKPPAPLPRDRSDIGPPPAPPVMPSKESVRSSTGTQGELLSEIRKGKDLHHVEEVVDKKRADEKSFLAAALAKKFGSALGDEDDDEREDDVTVILGAKAARAARPSPPIIEKEKPSPTAALLDQIKKGTNLKKVSSKARAKTGTSTQGAYAYADRTIRAAQDLIDEDEEEEDMEYDAGDWD